MLQNEEAAARVAESRARLLGHRQRRVPVRRGRRVGATDEVEHGWEGFGERDAVDIVHAEAGVVDEVGESDLLRPLRWPALGCLQSKRRTCVGEQRVDLCVHCEAMFRKVVARKGSGKRLAERSDLDVGAVVHGNATLLVCHAGNLSSHHAGFVRGRRHNCSDTGSCNTVGAEELIEFSRRYQRRCGSR